MKDRKKTVVVLLIIIIGLVVILASLISILLKPKFSITGFSLSDNSKNQLNEEYTGKNCIYKLGDKTVSFYSCRTKDDCDIKIQKLVKEDSLKKDYDLYNVSVEDCV